MSHSKFGRTHALMTGVSLAVLALAAQAAYAAPADDANIEEIVVRGFRTSLEKAIDEKRQDNGQQDTILAEDIGKFPDLNLSESIQRIPGVAITRDAGEGRELSVRGLTGVFTRVRINGLEALTTTGSADSSGGLNRTRAFDFNVFASDLFNAITVRKTAEAAVEEGSLGATVDLHTGRPFDYKGLTLTGGVQGTYNDLSKEANPRVTALFSDTWGNFGFLASVAFQRRDILEEGSSTVRWATPLISSPANSTYPGGFLASTAPNISLAQANAAMLPRFPRFDQYTDTSNRTGSTMSFQWKPDNDTTFTLDGLYSDFSATRLEQYVEIPGLSVSTGCPSGQATNKDGTCGTTHAKPVATGLAQTTLVNGTINNGILTAATVNGTDVRVEERYDELDTRFAQYSLNGEHRFNDRLTVSGVIGRSESDHHNPIQTTIGLDQYNVQGASYDFTNRIPTLSFGSASLTNPAAWTLTEIRERPQTATNIYDSGQLDAEYFVNDELTAKLGLDDKRYEFTTTGLRRSNGTTSNLENSIPAGAAAVNIGSYSQVVNVGGISTLLPDTPGLVPSVLQIYNQSIYPGSNGLGAFNIGPQPDLGDNKAVYEQDIGGYVQASFDLSPIGLPLRGNMGARIVGTKETSFGYGFIGGQQIPLNVDRSYADFLPSSNFVYEPMQDLLFRFSAARVMSRPDLGGLSPATSITVSGSSRNVTTGNPYLVPNRGNAYDLAVEWYPAKGTILSAAVFRKDLDSVVQNVTTAGVFSGNSLGIPDAVAIAACGAVVGCSPAAQWNFTAPRNASGTSLTGIELNYQQPLRFLPWFLKDTGILLNYTNVRSSETYISSSGQILETVDLLNLSRQTFNATFYYEDENLSARISGVYRSRFLTAVPDPTFGNSYDGTNSTFNLDASITYNWDEHMQIVMQGINLTDQYMDQFVLGQNLESVYHHTGRDFIFGFRYTY
jgi:iron complex outermembrane receptor protein